MMNSFFVSAICQTLFHSLWQGAITAVIAGIIILSTKKSSPALRYNLLLAIFFLFVVGAACTFIIGLLNPAVISNHSNTGYIQPLYLGNGAISWPFSWTITFCAALFNTHRNEIVLIWCFVILYRTIRLSLDLSKINRIKKEQVSPAGEYWNSQVIELCQQLGINKYVQLLQSGIAKVPQTIGYLKPIVLIPAGLITALPADQLKVIFLHELAHIRRNDYLVNILQTMVEILFFFNPAIWWLSSLLRAEREHCCDDIVVRNSANKLNYLKALISFEEIQHTLPQYASAITGATDSLVNRAKRIISNRNKSLHTMEKTVLATTLFLTALVAVAFRGINTGNPANPGQSLNVSHAMDPLGIKTVSYIRKDTIPAGNADPSIDSVLLISKVHAQADALRQKAENLRAQIEKTNALSKNKSALKQQLADQEISFEDQKRDIKRQMEIVKEGMKKALENNKGFDAAQRAALSKDIQAHSANIQKQMEMSNHDMLALNFQLQKAKEAGMLAKEFNKEQIQLQAEKVKAQAEEIKAQFEKIKESIKEKEDRDNKSKSYKHDTAD